MKHLISFAIIAVLTVVSGCSSSGSDQGSGPSPGATTTGPDANTGEGPSNSPPRSKLENTDVSADTVFNLASRGTAEDLSKTLLQVNKENRLKLLSSRNANGDTPLLISLRAKNTDVAEELLVFDASPFQKDSGGNSPQEVAAANNLDDIKEKLSNQEAIWGNELFLAIDGSDLNRVKQIIETLGAPADLHPVTTAYLEYN
jgi:ankyrin repeat protein